jgi:hypothetical protein
MHPKERTHNLLNKALNFISQSQLPDGSFPGYAWKPSGQTLEVHTIFDTVVILTALHATEFPKTYAQTIQKALVFLSKEQNSNGSFNYWKKDSPYFTQLGYPNDLDDTALALACYSLYKEGGFSGKDMADIAKILTSVEIKEGGPYNTWLCEFRNSKRWEDIDIGVNANIAYMLSTLGIELPGLTEFFERTIEEGTYRSAYYLSPIVLLYYLSRAYNSPLREQARGFLKRFQGASGTFHSPLMTALEISALIRFGEPKESCIDAIEFLFETVQKNGGWARDIFYLDPSTKDTTWYHGGDVLTTAFCVEAISLFNKEEEKVQATALEFQNERSAIIADFLSRSEANESFQKLSTLGLSKLETYEISEKSMLLPFYMRAALGKTFEDIPDEKLIELGSANLFGWIGYSLLDDASDGQADKTLLPFSAWCIRQLVDIYYNILPKENHHIVNCVLETIEKALYAEKEHRLVSTEGTISIEHLPTQDLIPVHEKSIGHCLPALSVLFLAGLPGDHETCHLVWNFFQQFLGARQLNDDAHDINAVFPN